MNCASINPAGINESKAKIIENIVNTNNIKFLTVSETNSYGTNKPNIGKSMVPFHRNRSTDGAARGGVCVFVDRELAKETVLLDVGGVEDGDEFVAVKCNYFSPALMLHLISQSPL